MLRSARVLLVGAVLAPALLLAGPAAPGNASTAATITLPPPLPVSVPPGTIQTSTAPYIGSAATSTANASGTVVTSVKMGSAAASAGTTAAAAGSRANAAGAVVASAVLGWEIGSFTATVGCSAGADILCWPKDPEFVPNADVVMPDPAGFTVPSPWVVASSLGAGKTATVSFDFTAEPTYEGSGAASYSWTAEFPHAFTVWNETVTLAYQTWCKTTSTGIIAAAGTGNLNGGTPTNSQYRMATPGTPLTTSGTIGSAACGTGKTFDHLRINTDADGLFDDSVFYPEGHGSRPEAVTDPDRTWLTRGQCVRPTDGASSFPEAESVVFTDLDSEVPVYPSVTCPEGRQLTRLEVHKMTPTLDAPYDDQVVWEWQSPTDPTDFPDCGGPTQCLLKLFRVQSDGSLADCFAGYADGLCSGWMKNQTDYECHYGPYVVDISQCYLYGPSFGTGTSAQTASQIDPDTKVRTIPSSDTDPDECQAAAISGTPCYGDPTTGQPEGGTSTPTEPATTGCPPDAGFLSFLNPFWLFSTLKCAFVPTQAGLRSAWSDGGIDWCETAPGVLACAIGAVVGPLGDIGTGPDPGCEGGTVDVPILDPRTEGDDEPFEMHPWSACNPTVQTLSELWLGLSTVGLYIGALLTGARMLGKTIGAEDAAGGAA